MMMKDRPGHNMTPSKRNCIFEKPKPKKKGRFVYQAMNSGGFQWFKATPVGTPCQAPNLNSFTSVPSFATTSETSRQPQTDFFPNESIVSEVSKPVKRKSKKRRKKKKSRKVIKRYGPMTVPNFPKALIKKTFIAPIEETSDGTMNAFFDYLISSQVGIVDYTYEGYFEYIPHAVKRALDIWRGKMKDMGDALCKIEPTISAANPVNVARKQALKAIEEQCQHIEKDLVEYEKMQIAAEDGSMLNDLLQKQPNGKEINGLLQEQLKGEESNVGNESNSTLIEHSIVTKEMNTEIYFILAAQQERLGLLDVTLHRIQKTEAGRKKFSVGMRKDRDLIVPVKPAHLTIISLVDAFRQLSG